MELKHKLPGIWGCVICKIYSNINVDTLFRFSYGETNMHVKSWVLFSVIIGLLWGCEGSAPTYSTIRICDADRGCSDQPSNYTTFDPSTAIPDPDPDGRLQVLSAMAEQSSRAAFDLGLRYLRGDGIVRNSWNGLKWLRTAGDRGDIRAQSLLGRMYLTGFEETGADYNEAQRWLSMAADQGDRKATVLLEEAESLRNDEDQFQTALRRWREAHTRVYWRTVRCYGEWRDDYTAYILP